MSPRRSLQHVVGGGDRVRPLLLRLRAVDDMQDQVGEDGLLERRLERLDERMRKLADEADRVREQDAAALVREGAGGRVQRVEEPLPDARRPAPVRALRRVDLPAFVYPASATVGSAARSRSARITARLRSTRSSRRRSAVIRSRARRRSVSIWDSPGPAYRSAVMRPPPRRSRWVQSPRMRARLYSSCASSTWSLPSAVWAWSAKMSRITAVRSITGTPSACSRLRSWRGTSSSSTATRLASAAADLPLQLGELSPAEVAVGIGLRFAPGSSPPPSPPRRCAAAPSARPAGRRDARRRGRLRLRWRAGGREGWRCRRSRLRRWLSDCRPLRFLCTDQMLGAAQGAACSAARAQPLAASRAAAPTITATKAERAADDRERVGAHRDRRRRGSLRRSPPGSRPPRRRRSRRPARRAEGRAPARERRRARRGSPTAVQGLSTPSGSAGTSLRERLERDVRDAEQGARPPTPAASSPVSEALVEPIAVRISRPPSASVPPSNASIVEPGRSRPPGRAWPAVRARKPSPAAQSTSPSHLATADRDAEPAARRDRQHRQAAGDHRLDQRQRRHRERRHVQAPGEKASPNPIAHQRERNRADALRSGLRIATSGALTAPRCLHSSATPEIRAQPSASISPISLIS